jgi:hypothetical protein
VRAANYIHSVFEDAGLTASEQNYDYHNQRATNLLWFRRPRGLLPITLSALTTTPSPSTPGADDKGGLLYDTVVFPLLLKRVYDDKDVQEWIIRSLGLDWTIVRPGLLTNRPATGRYRVLTASKDWRFGAISRTDVADFLVRQVNDRARIGTTPLLIS